MLRKINVENQTEALRLLLLQTASYLVEAELIGFTHIPPLKDTPETLRRSGETFYGWWKDEELRGAVSYTIQGGDVTICRMMVHPDHFRKGIAGRLLLAVQQVEPDAARFIVSTGADNVPAVSLYVKHGFSLNHRRELSSGLSLSTFVKTRKT